MAGKCKKTINSQDGFTAQTHKVLVLPSPFDLINQIRKILLQAITFFLKKSFFFFFNLKTKILQFYIIQFAIQKIYF